MLETFATFIHPCFADGIAGGLAIGFGYGISLVLGLCVAGRFTRLGEIWLGLLGCFLIGVLLLQPQHPDDELWFNRSISLFGLLFLSAGLSRSIESWRRDGRMQFSISVLLGVTGLVAIYLAMIRTSGLTQHAPIFWLGMAVIGILFPASLLSLTKIRRAFFAATASALICLSLAVTLAWLEGHVVQPNRIGWWPAALRYGVILFGMLTPTLMKRLWHESYEPIQKILWSIRGPRGQSNTDANKLQPIDATRLPVDDPRPAPSVPAYTPQSAVDVIV